MYIFKFIIICEMEMPSSNFWEGMGMWESSLMLNLNLSHTLVKLLSCKAFVLLWNTQWILKKLQLKKKKNIYLIKKKWKSYEMLILSSYLRSG